MGKLVSINIPFYGNQKLLERCITSIKLFTDYDNYELVLIDDGAQDESATRYAQSVSDVYIVHDENKGIAESRHDGVLASRGHYICTLDMDTVVMPHWLSQLVDTFEKNLDNADYRVYILAPIFSFYMGAYLFGVPDYNKETGLYFVSEVGTECMLFEKSLIDLIGNFDPELYNLWSDLDFSRRVNSDSIKGRPPKVAIDTRVVVYHWGYMKPGVGVDYGPVESTRGIPSASKAERMYRSMELIYKRWGVKHDALDQLRKQYGEKDDT